ncbi:SDR family oxidoreductase [Candidatus Woesebacteria bacterium]|nr:SDR family oxidoreductase [Candidatus Woesebacteria bacterium]
MKKIAIVTGASRGIGRAIAILLSQHQFNVIGVYAESIEKAKKIEKEHKGIIMYQADIGKADSIPKVIQFVIDKFHQIDVVVNNAGINLWGKVEAYPLENWNRMLNVNVTAKYLFAKCAIPFLKKSNNPNIINISSRAGMNEYVFSDFTTYCSNNAAITNFSLALAKELKPDGIRVNVVIPTVTNTDRFRRTFTKTEQEEVINAGKLGTPEEVAQTVLGIIQDKKKTGEIIIDKRVFIETLA